MSQDGSQISGGYSAGGIPCFQHPEKEPEEPEEEITLPDPQQQAQANQALVNALFTAVRQWLEVNEGEVSA